MGFTKFEELLEIVTKYIRNEESLKLIESAYTYAFKMHEGQYRKSGEAYIIHPLNVACILAQINVGPATICAGLLHDVLEDTPTTKEDLANLFGEDVAEIVDGATKVNQLKFVSALDKQADNNQHLLLAMAKDIRVIIVKLADRLHNIRTLSSLNSEQQGRIAKETLDIYAPLAHKLGMFKIKAELEDLSLRYLYPDKYFEIAQLVAQKKAERDLTVKLLIDKIGANLKQNGIHAEITGRAKHYYSIYNKMKRLNVAFHNLYDITAVRVIVDTEKECYEVLGVIHSQFKPIPGRFKDYIAMPKSNMYRSLHTSVLGPRSKPLEVQIRTKEMHEVAEFGVAAHWKYKEKGSIKAGSASDLQFAWMRKLAEMEQDSTNAGEYVEKVKIDLFSDQVFAFTPMGDVIDLPVYATPVDFAYRIHTDVGNRITGALVNGRISQLDRKLKNGDIVEVLTNKNSTPKLDWLNFVVTKQAQSKIRQWYKKNNKEEHISVGKGMLESEIGKSTFDECIKSGELEQIAHSMNFQTLEDLYAAIGWGETTVNKVTNKLSKPSDTANNGEIPTGRQFKKHKGDIAGLEGMLYNIAKCCTPVPGEPIVGVVTRSKGVSVHRIDCNSLENVPDERLLNIKWANENLNRTYIASIKIDVADKVGMLKDIITELADNNTNITYANVKSNPSKHIGTIEMGIEIDNIDTLRRVITNLQSLPDVYSVKRVPAISHNKQEKSQNHAQKQKNKSKK